MAPIKHKVKHCPKAKTPSSLRVRAYTNVAKTYETSGITASKRSRRNIARKEKQLKSMRRKCYEKKTLSHPEKTRVYFCGTRNKTPPGMPNNDSAGHSVLEFFDGCIVGAETDDVGTTITNGNDEFIALLPHKSNSDSLFNKGTAAVFETLLKTEKVGAKRSYNRAPAQTTGKCVYSCSGPKCRRNARGINDSSTDMDPTVRNEVFRIILQAEQVVRGNASSKYVHSHTKMMQTLRVPGFKGRSKSGKWGETTIFPNLALGRNVYLPVHRDKDCFLSVTSVCDSIESRRGEILAYFCFPYAGFAVALRHGDCLIFDPTEPHCISSKAVERDIYCASFYCKSALIGGNDNSRLLTENEMALVHPEDP